jgi:RNA polymerase sigma factor (TIGR02999 family)
LRGIDVKTETDNVTQLLINWREGDEDVPARLMPLVYEEVRHLAQKCLRRDQSNPTGQATALVHEAYQRLVDDKETTLKDRAHFYGIAARTVRRILIEHAWAHRAIRRGGLEQKFALDETHDQPGKGTVDLIALDGVLQALAQAYPRKSEVVELKFFGGLDLKEISEVLEVSEKQASRDWNFAKLWICRALSDAV